MGWVDQRLARGIRRSSRRLTHGESDGGVTGHGAMGHQATEPATAPAGPATAPGRRQSPGTHKDRDARRLDERPGHPCPARGNGVGRGKSVQGSVGHRTSR